MPSAPPVNELIDHIRAAIDRTVSAAAAAPTDGRRLLRVAALLRAAWDELELVSPERLPDVMARRAPL